MDFLLKDLRIIMEGRGGRKFVSKKEIIDLMEWNGKGGKEKEKEKESNMITSN